MICTPAVCATRLSASPSGWLPTANWWVDDVCAADTGAAAISEAPRAVANASDMTVRRCGVVVFIKSSPLDVLGM